MFTRYLYLPMLYSIENFKKPLSKEYFVMHFYKISGGEVDNTLSEHRVLHMLLPMSYSCAWTPPPNRNKLQLIFIFIYRLYTFLNIEYFKKHFWIHFSYEEMQWGISTWSHLFTKFSWHFLALNKPACIQIRLIVQ